MPRDPSQGPQPLSLDELDTVIGGAGGHASGTSHDPHKADATHTAYDAAAAVSAAAAPHGEAGYHVSVGDGQFHIPHPPGGDALQTLHAASAHLDQVHAEVTAAAVGSGARHPVADILSHAWTRGN